MAQFASLLLDSLRLIHGQTLLPPFGGRARIAEGRLRVFNRGWPRWLYSVSPGKLEKARLSQDGNTDVDVTTQFVLREFARRDGQGTIERERRA